MTFATLKHSCAVCMILLALTVVVCADDPKTAKPETPPLTLKEVSWFAGDWEGEKWGGAVQETWSKPSGGMMMCMFSYTKDGKLVFYEFLTLEQGEQGLTLYMRHFNPKLIGWEDKESPLVFSTRRVSAQEIVFERNDPAAKLRIKLVYKLAAQDRLSALLEREKDGKTSVETFTYKRVVR